MDIPFPGLPGPVQQASAAVANRRKKGRGILPRLLVLENESSSVLKDFDALIHRF